MSKHGQEHRSQVPAGLHFLVAFPVAGSCCSVSSLPFSTTMMSRAPTPPLSTRAAKTCRGQPGAACRGGAQDHHAFDFE
jgi:hypothetical protein